MYAAATGAGIANNTAVSFGSSARNINMMPAHIPTVRDATPVRLIIGTLGEAVMVGIVPASPDARATQPVDVEATLNEPESRWHETGAGRRAGPR